MAAEYSDYIIYADESGSPVIDGEIDPDFPVFVLAMMLVSKAAYATSIVPSIQKLKFDFVGHDQLVLHERDIRRQKDAFAFLQVDAALRAKFLAAIDMVVTSADMEVFAAVIDKKKHKEKYANPWSPYEISLVFLMERLLWRLLNFGQEGRLVHVVFECRGKKEDAALELAFRRIAANQMNFGYKNPDFTKLKWEPLFYRQKMQFVWLTIGRPDRPPRGAQKDKTSTAEPRLRCDIEQIRAGRTEMVSLKSRRGRENRDPNADRKNSSPFEANVRGTKAVCQALKRLTIELEKIFAC